jgi:hypothetical protein
MALDVEHRLAFLSCEENDLMTVFRLGSHQPIASFPQAKGGDVIAFDAGLKRILAIDLATHKLYVPEEQENGAPAAKIVVFDPVPVS